MLIKDESMQDDQGICQDERLERGRGGGVRSNEITKPCPVLTRAAIIDQVGSDELPVSDATDTSGTPPAHCRLQIDDPHSLQWKALSAASI